MMCIKTSTILFIPGQLQHTCEWWQLGVRGDRKGSRVSAAVLQEVASLWIIANTAELELVEVHKSCKVKTNLNWLAFI